MITYEVAGPTEAGDYLIGYPTPGAPAVFTVAGTASCQRAAISECARLNEAQIGDRRVGMRRAADFLAVDMAAALEGMP